MSENRTAVETEMHALISELTRELGIARAARQASDRALIEAVDCEHERLARLLHDTLSQSLNAARIYARLTRDTIQRTCPDASQASVTLEEVIKGAADEIQNLTRWLRPARLEGSDLIACMADLSQLVSRKVPCEFYSTKTAIDAQTEFQAELLRITQLALHALLRRGRAVAPELEFELELQTDQRYLVVEIRASCAEPLPFDLEVLLDARARAMGGSFTVQHEAKRGGTLTCRLPKRR